jgi:hypothetical protein
MPQSNFHALHPAAPEAELAYANLAYAVLAGLTSDLQSASPRRRSEARAAVHAHVQDVWLDLMAVGDGARARVERVLWELAR